MDNSVIIKGLNHGIVVVLDPEVEYGLLKEKVAIKFKESAKFLGNALMALSFEGRELDSVQQKEILNIITANSNLNIACILVNDPEMEEQFRKTLDLRPANSEHQDTPKNSAVNSETLKTSGQFYKGNLRSGQSIETDYNIVVIGDVNPGASIISKGNIIVLGALKGTVCAGSSGNENAFVLALDMNPVQIRISDIIARSPDNPVKTDAKETKIAFLENGSIYIEPATRQILSEIRL